MNETISTTGFAAGGDAVGRLEDGRAVFVTGGLPDEVIEVDVHTMKKSFAKGTALRVLEPSTARVTPPCPYLTQDPACGGCDLQHATAEGARSLKTRVVREQFTRLGKFETPPVAECLAASDDFGYRNRTSVLIDGDKVGYVARGSHTLVPNDHCMVLDPHVDAVVQSLRGTGAVGATVRAHTRGIIATLTPGVGPLELDGVSAGDRNDELTVALEGSNGAVAVRVGTPVEQDLNLRIGDVQSTFTWSIPQGSFFQVSDAGAKALAETVLTLLFTDRGANLKPDATRVADLFGGVGLFAVPSAHLGAQVTVVERDAPAAEAAEENMLAATAGRGTGVRCDAVAADVSEWLAALPEDTSFDAIIADPTRTGLEPGDAAAIAARADRAIVLVSCDVAAGARDTRALAEAGWRLHTVQPLDLFPQTSHVEIVSLLVPA